MEDWTDIGLKICKEVKVAGEQMHPKYITVISLRFPWNSNSLLDLPLPVGSVGSETSSMFLFQRTNQVWGICPDACDTYWSFTSSGFSCSMFLYRSNWDICPLVMWCLLLFRWRLGHLVRRHHSLKKSWSAPNVHVNFLFCNADCMLRV